MTRRAGLLAAVLVPYLFATAIPSSLEAAKPGRKLGRFLLTYYFVAEEYRGGSWPLYSPSCRRVLTRTSREFHREISIEGTGRLRDGRILNFAERCSCARKGFQGSRICYLVADKRYYPWGWGAEIDGRSQPLRPFHSLAVDPKVIPLGSTIFIPEWAGKKGPYGRRMNGCFRADDVGRLIRRKHVDFFAGTPEWAEFLDRAYGLTRVTVYRGGERCRGARPREWIAPPRVPRPKRLWRRSQR